MAKTAIPRSDVYVYALFREDGITPFYIGMGLGYRWLCHERQATKVKSRKNDVILAMRAAGFSDIPKKKLAENLTREQAMAMEIELIAMYGRAPYGPLTNLTKGGDRIVDLHPEARARQIASLKAASKRPEVIERLTSAALLRNANPDYRKKTGAGIKAFWDALTPDERAAKIQKAGKRSPEVIEAFRQRMLQPEFRAKINEAIRKPEIKAKRSAGQKAAFATPEAKLRRSEASKKVWANGNHGNHGEKVKAAFSSEEFKARQTIALKKSWTQERRAAAKARMVQRWAKVAEAKAQRIAEMSIGHQYALELSNPPTESQPPHSMPPPSSPHPRPPKRPPAELRIRNQSTRWSTDVNPSLPSLILA